MNISQIRLLNLTSIIKEEFGDNKSLLAKKMGVAANNFSRYYSANPRDRRNISDEAAEDIERAAGKPPGWLSKEHNEPAHFERLRDIMSSLDEDEQIYLVESAELYAAKAKSRHEK